MYQFAVEVTRAHGGHVKSSETWYFPSEGQVSEFVIGEARDYGSVPSGMEGFGEGIRVLEDPDGDTWSYEDSEFEGARRRIEDDCAGMSLKDSTEYHVSNQNDWANVKVTLLDRSEDSEE